MRGLGALEDQPRPGDRVKADARDAVLLAPLLHMGELTAVRVPTEVEQAVRDLVRAPEDVRGDLIRARHRVGKLLLRHGHVYDVGRPGPPSTPRG